MRKLIKIAHLYPDLFNIYGDSGNILTLKKRCEHHGIDYIVNEILANDILSDKYDIYFIGTEQNIENVDLFANFYENKKILQNEKENNAIILGLAGGYQLLGKYFINSANEKVEGLDLLDVYTKINNKRFSGNVTLKSNINGISNLVGYENHTTVTYIEKDSIPLATVIIGNGNNGIDKTEGALSKNVFGTNLYGAFLPNNIMFVDYILSLAVGKKLQTDSNSIEILTHNSLIGKSY